MTKCGGVIRGVIFHLNFILLLRYSRIHQSNRHAVFIRLVALKKSMDDETNSLKLSSIS